MDNVLIEPDDSLFAAPSWSHLNDWKTELRPHYATAHKMLGVARNPRITPADEVCKQIAESLGYGHTFEPLPVGVFFGGENATVADPFFGGEGPARTGCNFCGGCMVGCRYNAKNTLPKNYLYFAEKNGATGIPESKVLDIKPLPTQLETDPRYEVHFRSSTSLIPRHASVRARNVIVSAGTVDTLELLFRCRDETKSLHKISQQLGNRVRTNSENILGVTARSREVDFFKGVAITSISSLDDAHPTIQGHGGETVFSAHLRFADKYTGINEQGGPNASIRSPPRASRRARNGAEIGVFVPGQGN